MDERLTRFLPLRVVLRHHADGRWEGLTEESFCMNWSETTVRVWWSGKAYSMLGEHVINGIDDAEHNSKGGWRDDPQHQADLFRPDEEIFDPLSPDCPVEVDWERWFNASSKYGKRNPPFKVKER